MPGSSQDILAQNNINRFQLIHLLRHIVNIDVNDIFFSINNIFPKNISNLSKRDNVDVTTPPRWVMLMLVIIMVIEENHIVIVEFMQFMKYLLVSLIHSGNLTFQLSFRANQALPKRKVRGIIQSSLSMHFWSKTSSHPLYYDYVISVWRKRASSPISVLEIGRAGSPMHHRWDDKETDNHYHVIMVIVI